MAPPISPASSGPTPPRSWAYIRAKARWPSARTPISCSSTRAVARPCAPPNCTKPITAPGKVATSPPGLPSRCCAARSSSRTAPFRVISKPASSFCARYQTRLERGLWFKLMQQFRSVPPNIAFAIIAGILIGVGGVPVAADQTGVAPPEGSALLLEVLADGVQVYTCEAKGNRFGWSFKGPQANLFDKQGRQIGTHFAGPTWKMADGSAIVGEVAAKADAPEKDAIQWLLLPSKAH